MITASVMKELIKFQFLASARKMLTVSYCKLYKISLSSFIMCVNYTFALNGLWLKGELIILKIHRKITHLFFDQVFLKKNTPI